MCTLCSGSVGRYMRMRCRRHPRLSTTPLSSSAAAPCSILFIARWRSESGAGSSLQVQSNVPRHRRHKVHAVRIVPLALSYGHGVLDLLLEVDAGHQWNLN